MLRSSIAFPLEDNPFADALKKAWEEGWLDTFSENHFLIRALYGELPDFRTREQMNAVSVGLYFDCDTALIFITNLSQKVQRFIQLCGIANAKRFFEDQLSAGKDNYSEDQFFEALHEIHVLTYFTSYGNPDVDYEPELGGESGKKNPEYRVRNRFAIPSSKPEKPLIPAEDYLLDIEVKSIVGQVDKSIDLARPFVTPIVTIDYKKRDKLIRFCEERGFQVELPDVIHLCDFLNDAARKFQSPTQDNHFNLLFLNWTYREIPSLNYMEPLSLLDNLTNGLFKNSEIGKQFGLSADVFKNISAIFICSYPKQALAFNDIRWVFASRMCAVVFNSCLNEKQRLQLTSILHMNPSSNPPTPLILSYPPSDSVMGAIAVSNLEGIEKIIEEISWKEKRV